jgi:hypothetical protein
MTEFAADDLRASDSDRERTAEILRDAAGEGRLGLDELDDRLSAVYAAKTYGELAPIVRDLPQPAGAPAMAAGPADPARFGAEPTSSGAVAIMSGFDRSGRWTVPSLFRALAFMGGGEINMRDARFTTREVTIWVIAIMGGVGIIVPQDAEVHVTGFGLMGAFDHLRTPPAAPGGPVIRIKGLAFWGGVGILRRSPRLSGNSERGQRQDEWKQEIRERKEERKQEIRDRQEDSDR